MTLETFLREMPLHPDTKVEIISSQNKAQFGAGMGESEMDSFISYLSSDGRAQARILMVVATGHYTMAVHLDC